MSDDLVSPAVKLKRRQVLKAASNARSRVHKVCPALLELSIR